MPKMSSGFSVIKNSPPAMPDHLGNAAPGKMGKSQGESFPVGRKDRVVKSGLAGDANKS